MGRDLVKKCKSMSTYVENVNTGNGKDIATNEKVPRWDTFNTLFEISNTTRQMGV